MNEKYVFFWNRHSIWYFDMTDFREDPKMKLVGFQVSQLDEQSRILYVTCNNNAEKIVIVVR